MHVPKVAEHQKHFKKIWNIRIPFSTLETQFQHMWGEAWKLFKAVQVILMISWAWEPPV